MVDNNDVNITVPPPVYSASNPAPQSEDDVPAKGWTKRGLGFHREYHVSGGGERNVSYSRSFSGKGAVVIAFTVVGLVFALVAGVFVLIFMSR